MNLLLTCPQQVQQSRKGAEICLPPADPQLDFLSRLNDRIGNQATAGLGLLGFITAWALSHFYQVQESPLLFCLYSGLTALPMTIASIVLNETHQRGSSGLKRYPEPTNWRRAGVKVVGMFSTLLILFAVGEHMPRSLQGFYSPAIGFLLWINPFLLVAVPLYFIWIDRRMVVPEDGYWQMGLFTLGRWREINWGKLKNHAIEWTIKGYFVPFMFVGAVAHLHVLSQEGINFSAFGYFYGSILNLIYSIDICFGAIGYFLTLRVLDAQVRSCELTLLGWLSAVACYAPIAPLLWGNFLRYEGNTDWQDWLIPHPLLYISWGFAVLVLLTIYTWATCSFGCRFSNLTNRGIVVDGPYRYTKHPAYLAKNISWWMMAVPFVGHLTWQATTAACLALVVTNIIYFLRAVTEERHLMRDPAYVAYARWIGQYGLWAQLVQPRPPNEE